RPQTIVELPPARHLLIVDREHDVALRETRLIAGRAGEQTGDDDVVAHRVAVETEPRTRGTTRTTAVPQQLLAVVAVAFDRDREREASDLVQVERDDADDAAAHVDQRSTAESRVHRRGEDRAVEDV